MFTPRILPVLDIREGVVVHGIAGERESYRPIRSALTTSSEPLEIAATFASRLGLKRLYVADLDALERRAPPRLELYRELTARGFELLVDAGVTSARTASELVGTGVDGVVVALETLDAPERIDEVTAAITRERVVFSLDLKRGTPLGGPPAWEGQAPLDIARHVIDRGVGGLIALDLAAVGSSAGCPLEELLGAIRDHAPALRIISGGGVRDARDLKRLGAAGATDVLVATALHSGAIGREVTERA